MKTLFMCMMMLVACKEGSPRDLITLPQRPQEVPDWVPDGVEVTVTPDGKVVMTADLARAILRATQERQREYFLRRIATAADMGYRNCQDEIEGEDRVKVLAEDMKARGFGVTVTPVRNNWYILEVTW